MRFICLVKWVLSLTDFDPTHPPAHRADVAAIHAHIQRYEFASNLGEGAQFRSRMHCCRTGRAPIASLLRRRPRAGLEVSGQGDRPDGGDEAIQRGRCRPSAQVCGGRVASACMVAACGAGDLGTDRCCRSHNYTSHSTPHRHSSSPLNHI